MTENNPLVSIIVRTKDRPKLLKSALQSIAGQTYRPIEVVLVNDGGCDLEVEELKTILGNVSLNYQRLEKNTGRAHAGNVGIENAKGEYIGFLDDDDEFYPEHVETLASFLRQSDYKVAYADSLMVYKECRHDTCETINIGKEELVFSQDFNYDMLIFENYIPFMCLLFDKIVFINSGGLDKTFDLYEDWDLLIRIGEKHPFYHIRETTAKYNQWSTELQISQRNNDIDFLKQSYIKVIQKHMSKITPLKIHNYMSSRQALKDEVDAYKAKLREEEPLLIDLEFKLRERDFTIMHLEDLLRNKDIETTNITAVVQEKDALMAAMRATRGWRLLEKYRSIRDGARSFLYSYKNHRDHAIKGLIVLKNEGIRSFIRKANKKFLFNRFVKRAYNPITFSNISNTDAIDNPIKSKISVVIPTKNAGEEFDYALRRIVQQEGIGETELIIIDSGSTDHTVEISKSYSKNVFLISPEDFDHSKTRNFGAEKATGEFLVFTVQDAIPVSNQWLYKLLLPIYNGEADAVSVKQIPRSDADLFACWSYWSHNLGYLGHNHDQIKNNSQFTDFNKLGIQAKRAAASIDNVSLGIRKIVFDRYLFNSEYAEDLDLGIRLINDGYSLMFQASNAVIHSHNRHALYYLKRSYVDTKTLFKTLQVEPKDIPVDLVIGTISCLYSVLKLCVSNLNAIMKTRKQPDMLLGSLMDSIGIELKIFNPAQKTLKGDYLLDEFFKTIPPNNNKYMMFELFSIFADTLRNFSDFTKSFSDISDKKDDFVSSIYKIFSNTAGYYIGANTTEPIAFMHERI